MKTCESVLAYTQPIHALLLVYLQKSKGELSLYAIVALCLVALYLVALYLVALYLVALYLVALYLVALCILNHP
jgi:hypothetical protein